MGKLKEHEKLKVATMGKLLDITAIFTSDDEANAYMHRNPDEGVVAEIQGVVFIANVHDMGTPYRSGKS